MAGPCFRFGPVLALLGSLLAHGCGDDAGGARDAGASEDAQQGWASEVPLPEPVSNNAVAGVETEGGCMLFSFLGIDKSLEAGGIHNRGFRWREGDSEWIALPAVPGPGRLASNALALRGDPYLVGGYEVGANGSETSYDTLQRFNLQWGRWEDRAPLLRAVDDAGVATWRDRYIVVVSGWSDTGNIDDVQIYDIESDSWLAGTPFPGTRVFGQAMAIAGDELILIDGVSSGALGFRLVNQAWRAQLNPEDPATIVWSDLGQHTGPARYRAAAGTSASGAMLFHGGTSEPYNFDGLRYEGGDPATPLATTLRYADGVFDEGAIEAKPSATMDHRAMAGCGARLFTIGGMRSGPSASAEVWSLALE